MNITKTVNSIIRALATPEEKKLDCCIDRTYLKELCNYYAVDNPVNIYTNDKILWSYLEVVIPSTDDWYEDDEFSSFVTLLEMAIDDMVHTYG